MKKAFTIFLLLLAFAACKQHEPVEGPQASIKHTWPEVLAIAQKHGVDSTYIPYDKQSGLMLLEEAQIVAQALTIKKALDLSRQNSEFEKNAYKIRNYADYETLMAQYPLVLEAHQKAVETSEVGQRMEQEKRQGTWHIYWNATTGALRWVRPNDDLGHYEGENRIDNLPPVSIGSRY